MALLAEVRVPAGEFVLADALTNVPDVRVEIKRVVAGAEEVTPYFWVFGEQVDVFEKALHDDPDSVDVLSLDEGHSEERFFRVTWHWDVPNILTAVSDSERPLRPHPSRDAQPAREHDHPRGVRDGSDESRRGWECYHRGTLSAASLPPPR